MFQPSRQGGRGRGAGKGWLRSNPLLSGDL